MALDEHGSGSRPDLIVEVHHAGEDAELESSKEVVMIESKIGTWEGPEQLTASWSEVGPLNIVGGIEVTPKTRL